MDAGRITKAAQGRPSLSTATLTGPPDGNRFGAGLRHPARGPAVDSSRFKLTHYQSLSSATASWRLNAVSPVRSGISRRADGGRTYTNVNKHIAKARARVRLARLGDTAHERRSARI